MKDNVAGNVHALGLVQKYVILLFFNTSQAVNMALFVLHSPVNISSELAILRRTNVRPPLCNLAQDMLKMYKVHQNRLIEICLVQVII